MRQTTKSLGVMLLCLVFVIQGCTFASAMAELEQWSPTVLTAFAGVVSIINPPAGSALALSAAEIPKVWALVDAAINQYKTNPGTGSLANVTAALAAANAQFNQFLSVIQANPNSQDAKAAEAGMLLLIVTLQSIQAKLGPTVAPTPTAPTITFTATARAASMGIVAAKSNKDFKKKWSQLMIANGHSERVLR
jgi:hypothetical protein